MICANCFEESDTCMPDYEGLQRCEACGDAEARARKLSAQARRERVEAEYAAQDERSERDGGYKVQPINMRTRQAE